MNNLRAIIGQRIRVAREEKDLKQKDLAELVGMKNHQTISCIEQGERNVKPEELVSFMDVLEKSLEFFTDPYLITEKKVFSWRLSKDSHLEQEFENRAKNVVSLYRKAASLNEKKPPLLPSTLGMVFTKTNNPTIKIITKAHATDLYFERHKNNYLPFRKYIYSKMDRTICISNNGKTYIEKNINGNKINDNIIIRRLGILVHIILLPTTKPLCMILLND